MTDIFGRDTPAPDRSTLPPAGNEVYLRIKQEIVPDGSLSRTQHSLELLINGKPLQGLIQGLSFRMDAETLVPFVTVEFIPTKFDAEVKAMAAQLDLKQLKYVGCLTDPASTHVAAPLKEGGGG